MSRSPLDKVQVNALGLPNKPEIADFHFSDWTSFQIKNSILAPSEAAFEVGDDTGWDRVSQLCQLGAQFVLMVDDRPRLVGRVEALNTPLDARQSAIQSFVIRTKLSDAMYASAPQGLHLRGASIKQFILACYSAIGVSRDGDFDFRADVSRDLMTGKASKTTKKSSKPARALDELTDEQAKVNPPETVFAAVDRHLRRHGLLHWDGCDGRIVVGAPDDQQEPIARLRSFRPPHGQYNNVNSVERQLDVSQSPTSLGIFGVGGGTDFTKTRVSGILYNQDLLDRGFRRSVVIVDEAVKTKGLAEARANRELALRNRTLDRLAVTVDGLSWREGADLIPWTPDTTHDVVFESIGGALGTYYLEEVTMSRNASAGDVTKLGLVKQGVWVL
jgi:prophage tail gpP-like protein